MIPAIFESILNKSVVVIGDRVSILHPEILRKDVIDKLAYEAVFGSIETKPVARWIIWEIAQELGVRPSSIHPVYIAKGRGIIPNTFTVPAINIRGMAYDTAVALFTTAVATNTKAFICELARGEMGYTDQTPAEFATVILAGAIKSGYVGPVFIQGDHYQAKCSSTPGIPVEGEIEAIEKLIEDSIKAGFFNIDIDASTLVRLDEKLVSDQQIPNAVFTAEMLHVIRSIEPAGLTISVGGEIGHIGGRNSTTEDFTEFMHALAAESDGMTSISKISVATGTSHGGVVNPDGSLAKVDVDFNVLKDITRIARGEFEIGGSVQHGASTLPDEMLHQFPVADTLEIHLATGFQNLLMDHPAFPKHLLEDMYTWIDQNKQSERETDQTDEQFHYKLRKKCWGQFKKATWEIPADTRFQLRQSLMERFQLIFNELHIIGTAGIIDEYTPTLEIHKEIVDFALPPEVKEVIGLSD